VGCHPSKDRDRHLQTVRHQNRNPLSFRSNPLQLSGQAGDRPLVL
jgi:hypothetical protein